VKSSLPVERLLLADERSGIQVSSYWTEALQEAYTERDRYDELADVKYTDTGYIFDIMAVTVIQRRVSETMTQTADRLRYMV
jgi:hypothetical protein